MTSNYHTPIPSSPEQEATAGLFNSRLSSLDTSLGDAITVGQWNAAELAAARSPYVSLAARLNALILTGGNVATKANGVSAAGQKVLTVDSTTGFVVGAPVTYLLDGTTLEGNTIASIQAGVSLTLGTNIGTGGVLDDSYVSMISISEYLAAQAIPHAGTLMLPQTMEYANGGVFNVDAYDASLAAALAACHTAGGGTVRLTAGATYTVEAGETGYPVGSNTSIEGNGATIHITNDGSPIYKLLLVDGDAQNVTFDKLHFVGDNATGYIANWSHVISTPTDLATFKNIKLLNCTFENIVGQAFYFRDGSDVLISGCTFDNVSYGMNSNAKNSRLIGNVFKGSCGFEGGGYGLQVIGNVFQDMLPDSSILSLGGYIQAAHYEPGVIVSGNVVNGWAGTTIAFNVTESAQNVIISGNSFRNLSGVDVATIGNFSSGATYLINKIVIDNNVFTDIPDGSAIVLYSWQSSQDQTTDVLITNNKIGQIENTDVKTGIICGVDDAVITNNHVSVTGNNALQINTAARVVAHGNTFISGNQVTAISVVNGATWRGITDSAISYQVLFSDRLVTISDTAAPRTVTLPLATAFPPWPETLTIKDTSGAANTNNITITRNTGDTIDGATTKVISTAYGVVRLVSDGATGWYTV